jgi:hypothetical protein
MTARSTWGGGGAAIGRRARTTRQAAVLLLLAGCSALGPPPMEPLTATALEAARQRWQAHGSDSYRLVVRVRAPRTDPAVYAVEVAGGNLVRIERDGQSVKLEDAAHNDYSVSGLFELLRGDLRWTDVDAVGDTPAVDLRARFEPDTGRLVRYRRTVGTARPRVLMVEVLAYEPLETFRVASSP